MEILLITTIIFILILVIKAVQYEYAKENRITKRNTTPAVRQISSKQNNIKPPAIEIQVTTSYKTDYGETFEPIRQDTNGYWILNPNAPFELTVMICNKKIAQEIRNLLDSDEIRYQRQSNKLIELFASHNLKIKEIEDYKNKYKQQYFIKIEELKNMSNEWKISGDKDREDLLVEFREEAIDTIYERADSNLDILFEWEPKNLTIDDELIKEYGFEHIQTYLCYAGNLNKIHIAPNGSYSRPKFEKLMELGLAVNGKDLSREEILSTLTLKELNTFAANPEKEYNRKKQAIEYIVSRDDFEQKMGKFVSLREFFKLKPLPEKYNSLNLDDIRKTWTYHAEEIGLLIRTYYQSLYSLNNLKNNDYITGYTVGLFDKENPCPCAKERSLVKYSKYNPPKIPCHIGCNCYLHKEY
jgi:hypothetical protein